MTLRQSSFRFPVMFINIPVPIRFNWGFIESQMDKGKTTIPARENLKCGMVLFYISVVALTRVRPMKPDASFLYFGVNLFCLFFGN